MTTLNGISLENAINANVNSTVFAMGLVSANEFATDFNAKLKAHYMSDGLDENGKRIAVTTWLTSYFWNTGLIPSNKKGNRAIGLTTWKKKDQTQRMVCAGSVDKRELANRAYASINAVGKAISIQDGEGKEFKLDKAIESLLKKALENNISGAEVLTAVADMI